jgi:hypothetical protein
VSNRRDSPLAARLMDANVHESTIREDMLDAIPAVGGKPGRPWNHLDKCPR